MVFHFSCITSNPILWICKKCLVSSPSLWCHWRKQSALCELLSCHFVMYVSCFSKLSFSLLSQVFSLSSALLTAHELFGVSHSCIFFLSPLVHSKKKQKHFLKSPRIHQPYLSLHAFFFLNFCVICFQFPAFFVATFVNLNSFEAFI